MRAFLVWAILLVPIIGLALWASDSPRYDCERLNGQVIENWLGIYKDCLPQNG